MAIQIIKDQGVYFHGYDLQGLTNAVALEYGADMQDVTTLGMTTRKRIGGLKHVAARVEGYLDCAVASEQAIFDNIGVANKPITFGLTGDADGDACAFFNAVEGELGTGAEIGEVLPFSVSAEASAGGKLVRGTIMLNSRSAALTSSGNGTARQLGALTSAQSLYAVAHFWNVGTGSVTVKIQSDATNSFSGSETDRITLSAQSAIGSQLSSVAGAVTDTWWRVNYTISGASPSFKMLVALGIL